MVFRYRALSADGDYTFGQGSANFLIDSPAAVAQSILTRLKLMTGEWFLDKTEGTPYREAILGEHKQALYDLAIQERVLTTFGVTGIENYSSYLSPNRDLSVSMTVNTIFGPAPLEASF